MKAAIVTAPGKLEVMDIPMPVPGPYDCLVKIDACAVCSGTDSHIVYGKFLGRADYPFVLGHESTGIIVEVGPKVRHFRVGQRVTRPGAVLSGERVNGIGSSWGGYAEYGLVRDTVEAGRGRVKSSEMLASSRTPLPDGVGAVSGALSVNQREILSVVHHMTLGSNSRVAVVGSGYNGLLFSLYCKHFGAGQVIIIGSARVADRAVESFGADEFVEYRSLDAAAQAKAISKGEFTHVIDAVGSKSSVRLSGELLGRKTAFGCYGLDDVDETGEVLRSLAKGRPALDMTTREVDYVNEWYDLWREGFFNRLGMCDQVLPLDEINDALDKVMKREAIKIVLTI